MMYPEIRHKEIPCLAFMKEAECVLYVGPELTPKEITKLHLVHVDAPVIYLPEVIQGVSQEMFEYNFPGVPWPGEISAEMIYDQIRTELASHTITLDSRLLIKFEDEHYVIFDAKGSFDLVISYLINKCNAPKKQKRIVYHEANIDDDCYDILFSACSEDLRFSAVSADHKELSICENSVGTADETFDEVMDAVASDVREAIRQLLLSGFSASVIRSWLDEEVKLSRLRITRQYDILLVDYDKEVKMGPLPKTIFLFYLRHPEGVMFSHLMEHRSELLNIYSHVCKNDNPGKMLDSINRLIDPFDNSINEKCAAVKKAFMMQIEDSIARNYYITGAQGEKKGISLDRRLVEWKCEL